VDAKDGAQIYANELGNLWGVLQAGGNRHIVEIAQPPRHGTRSGLCSVLIDSQKAGEAPSIKAAANFAISHFVNRPDLWRRGSAPSAPGRSERASEASEGEVMLKTREIDLYRLDNVLERLGARRDRVSGDYYDLFNDRWRQARRWKGDLAARPGELTLDERAGLLEFERIADPELGAPPYRVSARGADGRPQQTFLRVVPAKEGFVVAMLGETAGVAAYTQISEQSWNNRAAAEEALHRDAWTRKEPAQKQARGARR
jgi:hypothetical protein